VQPGAIQGKVHGGQQAVVGAHVYLYAANTAGYNIGAATYGSASLLTSSVLVNEPNSSGVDTSGNYYVVTDGTGSFHISNDYTCTPDSNGVPGQQVYVYAVGGNPGSGINPAASFMAVLGDCPATGNFSSTPYVWVNEVSTVAAAYAMAGFAYDATHVSSSGTNLAKVGIENAFAAAANLALLSTGVALTTTPSGNATVPQTEINSLANILAACVNTSGPGSSACTTLFSNAESNGSSGTVPSETATAMINIAHNPAMNVAALFAIPVPASAFVPAMPVTPAPNDFSIGLNYATVNAGGSVGIAIDGSGNVWQTNEIYSLLVFSSTGAVLSGVNGYTDGLYGPGNPVIDPSGNTWVLQYAVVLNPPAPYSLFEFSDTGALLSPAGGFTGGGLNLPLGDAVDPMGNIWVGNLYPELSPYSGGSVSKFSNAGVPLSGPAGFTGGGIVGGWNIAIDVSGDAWVTNVDSNAVVELSNDGSFVSGTSGYKDGTAAYSAGIAIDRTGNVWVSYPSGLTTVQPHVTEFSSSGAVLNKYAGSGVGNGGSVAIDGGDNVWVPNYFGDSVAELSNAGVVLSGPNGYVNSALVGPYYVAVDGSGNVWVTSGSIYGQCNLVEYIGIAVPVVTPLSVGVKNSQLGKRP
jgi:hypothetical protein